MALIKGTHHVAIKCADGAMFDNEVKFYTEVLGLEVVRAWGEGADRGIMISTGDSIIEIFGAGMENKVNGSVNHFALLTDDVDACIAAARNAGCRITMEPQDIVIQSTPAYPIRCGFCAGPAGESIEFFCVK